MNNYNMILLTFVHLQIKFKIFENKHMHFHSFVKETKKQKHVCSIVKNKYQNLFYRRKREIFENKL